MKKKELFKIRSRAKVTHNHIPKVKTSNEIISAMAKRAVLLVDQIEAIKPMYKELDELTDRLLAMGFVAGNGLVAVDNFQSKNTTWKSSAFRRFELKRSI